MTEADEPILEVSGLGKSFAPNLSAARRAGLLGLLSELMPAALRPAGNRGQIDILRDISFTVEKGEGLAILGGNGEGKTTLLRLIAGLIKPDAGGITLRTSVSAVIELGAGVDNLLSGRENAELLLTWHGHPDVRSGVEKAENFAALGDKFDLPVQYYSTGMRARLAYAIAAQQEADLLLLDEALAVGDQDFQEKCMDHIGGHLERGGSLIFVSHNPELVFQCCSKAIVLEKGGIAKAGEVAACLDYYRRHTSPFRKHIPTDAEPSSCRVSIDGASWKDGHIAARIVIESDRPRLLRLVTSTSRGDGPNGTENFFFDKEARAVGKGCTSIDFRIAVDILPHGTNYLGAMLVDAETGKVLTRTGVNGGYAHIYRARPVRQRPSADATSS